MPSVALPRRFACQPALALALALALFAVSLPVQASPAADKATARALATDGIALYNEGDCKGAIDLLERAEQLYSAPVHLLYVARCQAKLGDLIEAAETYRTIKRMKLPPKAPAQFKAAVNDADTELETITDEIPRLILNVEPLPEGVTIAINGDDVPAAVLGVERLTNPGEQEITVTAPGFEPNAVTIELKRSEVRELEIPLTPAGGADAVPVADEGNGEELPPAEKPKRGPNGIIWFVGARVGVFIPAGNVGKTGGLLSENIPLTRLVGVGGGGDILGGLTFARYFTPFAFLTGYGLSSKDDPAFGTGENASGLMVGAGMRVGTPRRQFGGFGEAAFAFNSMAIGRGSRMLDTTCTITPTSPSVRLGGGFAIPITEAFELTPAVDFTFGRFTKLTVSGEGAGCTAVAETLGGDIQPDNQSNYIILQVGIGGEFVFGGHQ